jgi:hypothetical protein
MLDTENQEMFLVIRGSRRQTCPQADMVPFELAHRLRKNLEQRTKATTTMRKSTVEAKE